MTEQMKVIIELWLETGSMLQTCRDDIQVLSEQHERGTLLMDRITETGHRMDLVIDAVPRLVRLLELFPTEPKADDPTLDEALATASAAVTANDEPPGAGDNGEPVTGPEPEEAPTVDDDGEPLPDASLRGEPVTPEEETGEEDHTALGLPEDE